MEVHGTGWLWHANDWAITGAEGQSRTDTGLPPPVFELYWRCASQSLRGLLTLYRGGQGYRSIANHLRTLGVSTTYSAIRRLIKGQGAYGSAWD